MSGLGWAQRGVRSRRLGLLGLALLIGHAVSADTIYTRKLLRRGIDLDEPAAAALARTPLGAVMSAVPTPIVFDTPLAEVAALFAVSGASSLPVVLVGWIRHSDVLATLTGRAASAPTATTS